MRRQERTWLLALALVASAAWPASAYQLRGFVIATGAANAGTPGTKLAATAGQPVVGRSSQGTQVVSHGYWSAGGTSVLGVDDDDSGGSSLPKVLAFGRPSPNPSRAAVAFDLALPKDAEVGLEVFDAQGRRVAQVHRGALGAGQHRLAWSGRDAAGQRVSAGVFFARLQVNGRPQGTRRIVLAP